MLVGVVSNSVGRVEALSDAVRVLCGCGAERILHCGDLGGRHVLDALAEVESAFVWGERDGDRMGLLRRAQSLGIVCHGVLGDFEIDGKRFALLHGDDPRVLKMLTNERHHDYLIWGHRLEMEDRNAGRMRILHPGSLFGASRRTAMLINTETDEVTVLTV